MKKKLLISLLVICLIAGIVFLVIFITKGENPFMKETIFFHENADAVSFTNDLGITNIGDPFMLKISDNEYYMYCTSAADGFYCWRSEDMVHWADQKMCYTREQNSWGYDCFWAPEVVSYNGKYYMYYTAKSFFGRLYIGLAISDTPDGPFVDYRNRPLFDFGYAVIDANVLIDDDGSKYLYFSRDCSENVIDGINTSQSYGIKLSDDMMSVEGEPVLLITPEQDWETVSGSYMWNEGPEVYKHGDTYYLSYSANYYASSDYSVGYATSKSPLGPYVKAEENPILSSTGLKDVSGPGHHSFVPSPDGSELWIAYHSHTNVKVPSGDRKVNIARVGFTPGGKLYVNGPLTTAQPLPSGSGITNITNTFTATVDKEPIAILTDGMIQVHEENSLAATLTAGSDDKVIVSLTSSLDEGETIRAIALYPGYEKIDSISSIRLRIDGKYYSEEYFITEENTSPVILSFDPTSAKKVDIIITPADSKAEIELSEIEIFK